MYTLETAFTPLKVGPITLRNRFIKSAANEAMSIKGIPTRALVKHHSDLAEGGIGLTTVAYMSVTKRGRTLPDQIWMRPDIAPDLRALTDSVHQKGGAISAQLTHGGAFVTGMFVPGRTISSVSGLNPGGFMKGNILTRAMTENDMNVVMTGTGGIIEIQGTAEGSPFSREQAIGLLDLAAGGIGDLLEEQKSVLESL